MVTHKVAIFIQHVKIILMDQNLILLLFTEQRNSDDDSIIDLYNNRWPLAYLCNSYYNWSMYEMIYFIDHFFSIRLQFGYFPDHV